MARDVVERRGDHEQGSGEARGGAQALPGSCESRIGWRLGPTRRKSRSDQVGDSQFPGKRHPMVQKVIDVVGVSPVSCAKAAQNAVPEAAETVRAMRWEGGGAA